MRLLSRGLEFSSVEVDVTAFLLTWRLASLMRRLESSEMCFRWLELRSSEGLILEIENVKLENSSLSKPKLSQQ